MDSPPLPTFNPVEADTDTDSEMSWISVSERNESATASTDTESTELYSWSSGESDAELNFDRVSTGVRFTLKGIGREAPWDVLPKSRGGIDLYIFNPRRRQLDVFSLKRLKKPNCPNPVQLQPSRSMKIANLKAAESVQSCCYNGRIYITSNNRWMLIVKPEDGHVESRWHLEYNQSIRYTTINNTNGTILIPNVPLSEIAQYDSNGNLLHRINLVNILQHQNRPFSAVLSCTDNTYVVALCSSRATEPQDRLIEVRLNIDGSVEELRKKTIPQNARFLPYDAVRGLATSERSLTDHNVTFVKMLDGDWKHSRHIVKLQCSRPLPRRFPYRVGLSEKYLVVSDRGGSFYFFNILSTK